MLFTTLIFSFAFGEFIVIFLSLAGYLIFFSMVVIDLPVDRIKPIMKKVLIIIVEPVVPKILIKSDKPTSPKIPPPCPWAPKSALFLNLSIKLISSKVECVCK